MTAVNQHPNPTLTVGDSGGVTLDAKDVQRLVVSHGLFPLVIVRLSRMKCTPDLDPWAAPGNRRQPDNLYSVDSSFKEAQNSIRMDKSEPPWRARAPRESDYCQ